MGIGNQSATKVPGTDTTYVRCAWSACWSVGKLIKSEQTKSERTKSEQTKSELAKNELTKTQQSDKKRQKTHNKRVQQPSS
jgi:hypothetical protein